MLAGAVATRGYPLAKRGRIVSTIMPPRLPRSMPPTHKRNLGRSASNVPSVAGFIGAAKTDVLVYMDVPTARGNQTSLNQLDREPGKIMRRTEVAGIPNGGWYRLPHRCCLLEPSEEADQRTHYTTLETAVPLSADTIINLLSDLMTKRCFTKVLVAHLG